MRFRKSPFGLFQGTNSLHGLEEETGVSGGRVQE